MPSKSTLIVILLLTFLAAVTGWNYLKRPFAEVANTQVSPTPSPITTEDSSLTATDVMLAGLTPQQKVAAILAFPISLTASPSAVYATDLAWIAEHKPGAVTIFGSSVSQAQVETLRQDLLDAYSSSDSASSEPLLVVDHEGGQVQRLSGAGFTRLPSWRALCAQPATESATVIQTSLSELQTSGIDIVLSPMVEVATSHAVLRDRVCSGDPEVVVERAVSFIESAESVGVLPVLKHFPGIGKTTRDLHFSFDRVSVTPEDALIFRYILDRFPQLGVMIAPVGVNNQYPDVPCTISFDCVKELASNFPEVLVVSDGLDMAASRYSSEGQLTLAETAVRAAKAGNNVLIFGPEVTASEMTEVFAALVAAYETDPLVKDAVDAGAAKVLTRSRL